MSYKNPVTAEQVLCPIDDTAAAPSIQFGGPTNAKSGTGIFGNQNSIYFVVNGTIVYTLGASGFSGLGTILAITSGTTVGGGVTETLTVPGLLATDTILSVSGAATGSNNQALSGWGSQANNSISTHWTANPGTGATVVVTVQR